MAHIRNKRGVALVIVLGIIAMSTAMVAIVFYLIQKGTEVSGLEKKYQTAKEASIGAIDVFTKEIIPTAISTARITPGSSLTTALGKFSTITSATVTAVTTNTCFSDKLLKPTANWGSGCNSSTDPKTSPDIRFTLSGTGTSPFNVYLKIVDTVGGNSNTSDVTLEGAGVAESSGAVVSVQHFPYMYSMEVQGERQQNPSERANFEVLYAY